MQHATLMDVFNTATQAASPFIQQRTQELKERNDLELRNNQARFATDLQNFVRDNPYNGNFDEYMGKIQNYTDKWYLDAGIKNTSPYYQKSLEQMRTQSQEAARNYTLVQEDAWRIQQEGVSLKNDIQGYIDAGWDPKLTMDAIYNRIDLSKTRQQIDPAEEDKLRHSAGRTVWEKVVTDTLGQITDVNKLQGAMDEVNKRFDFMGSNQLQVYDKEGKLIAPVERPWLDGQKDLEKAFLEKETKRIQGVHFEKFREQQAYMDRLVISGELQQAIDHGKVWGAEWNKYYNPNNPQFANSNQDYRDRGSGYFDWKKLEAALKQGKKKDDLLPDYNLEMFIRPQFQGDGTVITGYQADGTPILTKYDSLKEALGGFLSFKRQAFFASKGGEDAVTLQLWQSEESEWLQKFYTEVGTALGQINPELKADFEKFRKFDTYLTEGDKKKPNEFYNKDIEKLYKNDPGARDLYAQRCVDFFTSIFFNGIRDAPTIRQMMRDFTGQEITKVLQWKNTESEEGDKIKQLKAFSDKAMAEEGEDIVFKKHEPERLSLGSIEPVYVWRNDAQKEAVEQVTEEERKSTADALGLELSNLTPHWMPSMRRKGDVIPKNLFVVEEGDEVGDKAGTYYMDYDEEANQIVMKQNPKTGTWEEYKKIERPLTRTETVERHERTIEDYSKAVREGRNPLTGEKLTIDYRRTPPPNDPWSDLWDKPQARLPKDVIWARYFMQQGQGK